MSFDIVRLSIIAFLLHAGVTVVSADDRSQGPSVSLYVLAPKHGEVAGVGSRVFPVDLAAHFEGNVASKGSLPELTGTGAQANQPPFPGIFGIGAKRDHFPGLVVRKGTSMHQTMSMAIYSLLSIVGMVLVVMWGMNAAGLRREEIEQDMSEQSDSREICQGNSFLRDDADREPSVATPSWFGQKTGTG